MIRSVTYTCGCVVTTDKPPAVCPWHPGGSWKITTTAGEFKAPGMVHPVSSAWVCKP